MMLPTWMLAYTQPSLVTANERTAGGPPHGVCHCARAGRRSNDMLARGSLTPGKRR